jgi:hypothetical protein
VAVDDGIDVFDLVVALYERVGVVQHAAAVITVDERQTFGCEQVTQMRGAQRREHDPRVAVRVTRTEVVQVHLVGAFADRHSVLERALRHSAAVVLLEDVHLLHVRLGVLLRDDFDAGRELDVAAHMVAVRMRVDQRRHRFVGERLDLVEDRLPPAGILRVDDDDPVGRDEHRCVAAAALQHVQVVFHLVDVDVLRSLLLLRRLRLHGRERTAREQDAQHDPSFHDSPPGKKTR